MSWLRIDDGFAQHPKLEGWSTAQKWALIELFLYCARHKTDGYVPSDLSLLPRAVTRRFLAMAESAGFLDRLKDGSLTVHDWSTYNPADPTAAERMRRHRERRNGNRNDDRNETVSSRARHPSRPLSDLNPQPELQDEGAAAEIRKLAEASIRGAA